MRILWMLFVSIIGIATVQADPAAEAVIMAQTELLLNRIQVEEQSGIDEASLESLVMDTISPHVDFSLFSRLVLGKYRKRLAPADMARFERGLTGAVVKTYVASLAGVSGLEVSYLGVQKGKKKRRVTVLTSVKSSGNPTVRIDYRLYEKDGQWKVYDVVIEGISMMMNYRTVLAEKIRSEGIEAVISSFNSNGKLLAAG
jgi:phospholipid transport system substrate-binding protein